LRFFKDFLFTDTSLIKGHVNTGDQRLSTFLNKTQKRFLGIEDATLIQHDGSGRTTAEWVQVHVDAILFAYELEGSGDEGLRLIAEHERDEIEVTAHFGGNHPLRFSGKVRKHSLDAETFPGRNFIVVVEPRFEGLAIPPASEFTIMENLPYAIVNRSRLALIFR
jgi:hypothetical protein